MSWNHSDYLVCSQGQSKSVQIFNTLVNFDLQIDCADLWVDRELEIPKMKESIVVY